MAMVVTHSGHKFPLAKSPLPSLRKCVASTCSAPGTPPPPSSLTPPQSPKHTYKYCTGNRPPIYTLFSAYLPSTLPPTLQSMRNLNSNPIYSTCPCRDRMAS